MHEGLVFSTETSTVIVTLTPLSTTSSSSALIEMPNRGKALAVEMSLRPKGGLLSERRGQCKLARERSSNDVPAKEHLEARGVASRQLGEGGDFVVDEDLDAYAVKADQ